MAWIYFYKLLLTSEKKNIWHILYKQWLYNKCYYINNDQTTNVIKVSEDYIQFDTEEVNAKRAER